MALPDPNLTFMHRALALAEHGRGCVEPNPVVGAVVVREGRIVGEGWHGRFGGPHAEVHALDEAGERARGATLYVTLEPCAHRGKTEPCAPRVAASGISRVVIAVLDPTEKTHGKGLALLKEHGIEADVGVCRESAVRQNAAFFKQAVVGRPLVRAKWAMTADGKIATHTGQSRWISGEQSRRMVHELRGRADCVMVGAGTARADDPDLTCRLTDARRTAARLVVCGRRAIVPTSVLARTARDVPVLLAHPVGLAPEGADELVHMGCELVPVQPAAPHRVDLASLLDELGARGMSNVLVEGGGDLLGGLFDARLVDAATVFVAPLVAGGARAVTPVAGQGVSTIRGAQAFRNWEWRRMGDDLLLEGWLVDPLEWAR